jgi:hypothetical protein
MGPLFIVENIILIGAAVYVLLHGHPVFAVFLVLCCNQISSINRKRD